MNKKELVDVILSRVKGVADVDQSMELQTLKETHTSNGKSIGKIRYFYSILGIFRSGEELETP